MSKSRKDPKGRALRQGEVYRTSDNRYVYRYTDSFGKVRSIYARDLMKLRKKEEELVRDQLDGINTYVRGFATVNYAFDRYMSTKVELRATTKSGYLYTYDHFVRDNFGKRKLSDIRYSDVIKYYLSIINDQGHSLSIVDSIHTLLNPTFKMAVRDGILRTNPAEGVLRDIFKKTGNKSNKKHALTLEQQRKFMEYTANHPDYCHWWPMFMVMLGTGLRIGELIGLRWEDCDMEKRIITVDHSLSYCGFYETDRDRYCEFILHLPKTEAGIRTIPMFDEVYDALMIEKEYQEATGTENVAEIEGMSGFIFSNRFNRVFIPQSVNRAIRRVYESCNADEVLKAAKEKREPVLIPHITCHSFRHTFCTRMCENESNIKVIQSIMGHKDIQTTMDIYADVTDEKKLDAFRELSRCEKFF